MIDVHAHLHDPAFDTDRDEVVRRAEEAGVEKIITIGTSIEESRKAVACAEQYENVYASVGIHPDELSLESELKNFELLISQLRKVTENRKVIAIGECGLDYFSYDDEQGVVDEKKDQQKELFLMQIELARELKLPLIIHCRPSRGTADAYEDMYHLLRNQNSRFLSSDSGFILHCYMGDTEVTKKFLELPNTFFSFTGNITYPVRKSVVGTKDDLSETVKMIPLERILAETDCPYLAPQSYRGTRNEPAYVQAVAEKIAELQGISLDVVKQAIEMNARVIFKREI